MSASAQRPIADPEELVGHFRAGVKAADALGVGMEHEKIGVFTDPARLGKALDYETIRTLLEAMADRGWSAPRSTAG